MSDVAEFEVEKVCIPANTNGYKLLSVPCGSLMIVVKNSDVATLHSSDSAEQMSLRLGAVLFTAAYADCSISTGSDDIVIYRAHANLGDK